MFDYKLARVEKILNRLFHKGFFSGKNIYLFGVSENTRQIIKILRNFQLDPVSVLDNDKVKQGAFCSGIPVIPVEGVEDLLNHKNLYVVCSPYWLEMTAQLRDKGVKKENILMMYREQRLIECLHHAILGKQIYSRLIARYGDVPLFVCPYTGTGDIYLIGTFWKQYTEANQIKDYVFLVISKACEKVTRLFDIKNVVVFKQKAACSYLIRYYMLCPEKVKLTLLNDSWAQTHTNPLEWFRGYKGLGFTTLFRKFVFNFPDTIFPQHPIFRDASKEVEKLLSQHQLQAGNSVVLSPYSNTLADLSEAFWAELASGLKQAGFCVCTNSGGDTEPAIEGTTQVCFPLDIAPQVVETAGYFIGIRSGFCDIISGAKAKKIILYDKKERFFNSSTYDYFSLEKMGLSEDAIEIQFESGDNVLCKKILDVMGTS